MKGKKIIKVSDIVKSKGLKKLIIDRQITSDFVLELYERSKKLRGKKKEEMLTIAETLSKHVGKWLVE
jgi:propanediol dehydratase small subunit